MPQDTPGIKILKPKRLKNKPRIQNDSDMQLPYIRVDDSDAALPLGYRCRLYELFSQIEKEFEMLYAENLTLKEKIEVMTDQLEREPSLALNADRASELIDGGDAAKSAKSKRESITASQLSQKIKNTYKLKASTSKIVSSFKTSAITCQVVAEFLGHRDGVWEVSTSKVGPSVIGTASADNTARIWDVLTGNCLIQYLGHSGSVNSLRFHPTADLVITASGDQSVHIWRASVPPAMETSRGLVSDDSIETGDASEGEADQTGIVIKTPLSEIGGHHTGVVIAADWLVDGDQVITASWDRTANVYDVHTQTLISQLVGHDQELTYTSCHPTQKLLLTTSKDSTFRLWDFREAIHSVSVFQGHTESVSSATFTTGDKVVSGSDDRTVKVWDLKNMQSPLVTIRLDSPVNRLSVSSQQIIGIPHDNRHVRLYDLNGTRLARLPKSSRQGHQRMVCSVAWLNDQPAMKSNFFTCGFDRQVLSWNITFPSREDSKPVTSKVS